MTINKIIKQIKIVSIDNVNQVLGRSCESYCGLQSVVGSSSESSGDISTKVEYNASSGAALPIWHTTFYMTHVTYGIRYDCGRCCGSHRESLIVYLVADLKPGILVSSEQPKDPPFFVRVMNNQGRPWPKRRPCD